MTFTTVQARIRAGAVRALGAVLAVGTGVVAAAPFAYVTNQGSHDVTVVDVAKRRAVATVPVGRAPAAVVAVSALGKVFVGHPEGGTISVIEMATNRVVDTLAAGAGPMGLDASADGSRLVASDWSRDRLLVFDGADLRRAPLAIAVGRYPAGVAVHPDGRTVFVAERDDDHVAVVDLVDGRVRARVAVGRHPFALMLDRGRDRLFVLNVYSDDATVIDVQTLRPLATVAVGKAPYGAALTDDGRFVYVTNQRADSVSVLDAQSLAVLRTLEGFGYPEGIAAHGEHVYVVNWMDDNLSIVDAATGRVLGTVATGQNSRGFGAFIGAPAAR